MTVVTFGIVGQGNAPLSTLNGFGLRLLVWRIRPSLRLSVIYTFLDDMSDATVEQQTITDLMDIHRHYTHRTQDDNDKAIKILLDKIKDPEKINWHPRLYKTLAECNITPPPSRSCRLQICPDEYLPRCPHGNRKPKIHHHKKL